ncbi:MAG: acyltransferase [Rubrivivax sp.]
MSRLGQASPAHAPAVHATASLPRWLRVTRYPLYLRRIVDQLLGQAVLAREGVRAGRGLSILGRPVVSRAPGGSIQLGDRVALCSSSEDTALGVSHPVILRALQPGSRLTIGSDCALSGTSICAALSVSIGDRCLFGADAIVVDTDFHPLHTQGRRHAPLDEAISRPVVIGNDVFVGARAIILKGVIIGEGAVIGAGAVVSSDVAPGTTVAGNPARVVARASGAVA